MEYLKTLINGKKIGNLSIGCMRFPSRQSAVEIIRKLVEKDVLYIDSAPCYCYQSDDENSETWVGEAIKGVRDKVILSAKCATGDGGVGLGEYSPSHGFSVRTADDVRRQIDRSLKKLGVDYFDIYQQWAVHSMLIYEEIFKKGGWLEGVLKAKDEGLIKHIGMTGHITNDELMTTIGSFDWEMYTLPFYALESTRAPFIQKMVEKNIPVIAMNPMAGGFLSNASGEIIEKFLKKYNLRSLAEMGLRFSTAYGTSALCGFTDVWQVEDNLESVSKPIMSVKKAQEMQAEFLTLLNHESFKCTGCGYCMPCPENINIPEVLKNRNLYKVLGMDAAKAHLMNISKPSILTCTKCKQCEAKCPNDVKVTELFDEILKY